jgi:hypothetical protein
LPDSGGGGLHPARRWDKICMTLAVTQSGKIAIGLLPDMAVHTYNFDNEAQEIFILISRNK